MLPRAQFQVTLLSGVKDNFILVPKNFSQAVKAYFPDSGVVAMRVEWTGPDMEDPSTIQPQQAYVGYKTSNEGSDKLGKHTVGIPVDIAHSLGIQAAVDLASNAFSG